MEDYNQSPPGLFRQMRGGTVDQPSLALDIARLLIVRHYGQDVLACSEPLTIADLGDEWRIEGRAYADQFEQRHEALVKIAKSDGRILQLEIQTGFKVGKEVSEIIKKAKGQN